MDGGVMQLVYAIAFGETCLKQFELIAEGLERCNIDILLITNKAYFSKRVKVLRVAGVQDTARQFAYRTQVFTLFDFSQYERVWYIDTDFLIFKDLFKKYESNQLNVFVCREPKTSMQNEHFSLALNRHEYYLAKPQQGINAGIISVPLRHVGFWEHYDNELRQYQRTVEREWIMEQQVLNRIYMRYRDRFHIKVFDPEDVGFPLKGVNSKEYTWHYACYKQNEKLPLMRIKWQSYKN